VSEDLSIRVVGLRRFVTLYKIAPYRNSLLLTYLYTPPKGQSLYLLFFVLKTGCILELLDVTSIEK